MAARDMELEIVGVHLVNILKFTGEMQEAQGAGTVVFVWSDSGPTVVWKTMEDLRKLSVDFASVLEQSDAGKGVYSVMFVEPARSSSYVFTMMLKSDDVWRDNTPKKFVLLDEVVVTPQEDEEE